MALSYQDSSDFYTVYILIVTVYLSSVFRRIDKLKNEVIEMAVFKFQGQEIVFSKPNIEEHFPLGDLLFSFLEFDFFKYNKERYIFINEINDSDNNPIDVLQQVNRLVAYGKDHSCLSFELEDLKSGKFLIPSWHQYFCSVSQGLNYQEPRREALRIIEKYDYKSAQSAIYETLRFCMDVDYSDQLNSFSALERYYIGKISKSFKLPIDTNRIPAGIIDDSFAKAYNIYNDLILPQNFQSLNQIDFEKFKAIFNITPCAISEGYSCGNPTDIATMELVKMIQNNMHVRFCAVCGNLFIVTSKESTKYCRRTYSDKKSNCQTIGNSRDSKARIRENPIEKAYWNTYNRYRKQTQQFNQDKFREWIKEATIMKQQVKDGIHTEAEAIAFFGRRNLFSKHGDMKV